MHRFSGSLSLSRRVQPGTFSRRLLPFPLSGTPLETFSSRQTSHTNGKAPTQKKREAISRHPPPLSAHHPTSHGGPTSVYETHAQVNGGDLKDGRQWSLVLCPVIRTPLPRREQDWGPRSEPQDCDVSSGSQCKGQPRVGRVYAVVV